MEVSEATQVGEARRLAAALSREAALNEADAGKVALIATELASNLVKHTAGRGGQMVLRRLEPAEGGPGVELLALDRGPGMRNPSRCFEDGYSTSGTAGIGLGGVRRMASRFDLYTVPAQGTVVMARIRAGDDPRSRPTGSGEAIELGAVCAALKGEPVCGDAWALRDGPHPGLIVADGLGHGAEAHRAAAAAVEAFREAGDATPAQALEAAHRRLRSTRGAAAAVLRLSDKVAEFAGIGNIAGVTCGAERNGHMVSLGGIVGHECRKVQQFAYETAPGELIILHSDGLQTRWDLNDYPGLQRRHPALVAGVLFRDFRRVRDDATVVVLRRPA
jgi:anti-sigma regulatory factor (Ser/Thr protein kinase)